MTMNPKKKVAKAVDLIPFGYTAMDSAMADFNHDGSADYVYVLSSGSNADSAEEKNRSLLVAESNAGAYQLSVFCKNAILCQQCGGMMGDPYVGVQFENNIIKINHYGGSAWRWGFELIFQYKQGQWQLIGFSNESYWVNADCSDDVGNGAYNLLDINYNTQKAHVIKTKDDACKPYLDEWKLFKSRPLINLNQFDIDKAMNEKYTPAELR